MQQQQGFENCNNNSNNEAIFCNSFSNNNNQVDNLTRMNLNDNSNCQDQISPDELQPHQQYQQRQLRQLQQQQLLLSRQQQIKQEYAREVNRNFSSLSPQ